MKLFWQTAGNCKEAIYLHISQTRCLFIACVCLVCGVFVNLVCQLFGAEQVTFSLKTADDKTFYSFKLRVCVLHWGPICVPNNQSLQTRSSLGT